MLKKSSIIGLFSLIGLNASASMYGTYYTLLVTNDQSSKNTICVVGEPWTNDTNCHPIEPGKTVDLGYFTCRSNSWFDDSCNPRTADIYRLSNDINGLQTPVKIGNIVLKAIAACTFDAGDFMHVNMFDSSATETHKRGGKCFNWNTVYEYVTVTDNYTVPSLGAQ